MVVFAVIVVVAMVFVDCNETARYEKCVQYHPPAECKK